MPGILTAGHGCDTLLQAVPFVREDVQRIASGSATDHAVVIVPFHVAGWAPSAPGDGFHRELSTLRPTELIVLRI